MSYRYRVYGLNIQSEIECEELPLTEGEPDIFIEYGEVQDHIDNPVRVKFLTEVKPGSFLIKAPNIAKYFIQEGRSITIDKDPQSSLSEVKVYLLGSALAGILHQRAMFPFHASAMQINEKSILMCGNSGYGKSTLAAELMKRGHAFISDDVSVITKNKDNQLVVHPGYPNFRLWKQSLIMLDQSEVGLKQIRSDINKYNLEIRDNIVRSETPIEYIFFLDKKYEDEGFEINEIKGAERYNQLHKATYRRGLLQGHGRMQEHFNLCIQIGENCKLYSISRNQIENTLHQLADTIENILSDV